MVLDAGGRVYLAKESYLDAAVFRTMYPRVNEWLAKKAVYEKKTWAAFLKSHGSTLSACDFFSVETLGLSGHYEVA